MLLIHCDYRSDRIPHRIGEWIRSYPDFSYGIYLLQIPTASLF